MGYAFETIKGLNLDTICLYISLNPINGSKWGF
jgi:hypothetical protein